jgi:hypothetical protein
MIEGYERQLKPWRKVWAFIAALGAAAVFVFGIGVSYQQFRGGNATKDDVKKSIDTHVIQDLVPVQNDVQQIKKDLAPIKTGVQALVKEQKATKAVERAKRKLDRYDKEYQEALQEYTADKAAGRSAGARPRKTKDHIDLEATVQELEEKL